jgi:hypothetical protein
VHAEALLAARPLPEELQRLHRSGKPEVLHALLQQVNCCTQSAQNMMIC